MKDRNDQAWAVFWCSLLSPLLVGEIPADQRGRYFRELSEEERLLPNGRRKRISVRTLRRQWSRLREQGVAGLFRRRRKDRGQARKAQADLLARAVELKKEQPYRSDQVINPILKREFGRVVPRSTLYRHLHREGATRRKLGISKEKVRCRWTRDQSNALWVGDFEHGPPVVYQDHAVKTYLSAWIDCHSRYIVGARYYVRENLDVLVDSLLRAWGQHGASRELYVDNAKIYHSNGLTLACTALNIQLLHRPPRDPPAGGLIERFFRTNQEQLEAEVRATHLLTLDDLNRVLAAWLETAYHAHPHSETKQTPQDRYRAGSPFTRAVNLNAVLSFFHRHQQCTVYEDFSDVRLDGVYYAVDSKLRGDRLTVEYDPFGPRDEVTLYGLSGTYLGVGRRYQREKGSHPQPEAPSNAGPIEPTYLNVLQADLAAAHQRQRQAGIDYHSARQRNIWSLTSFAKSFARLLGRPAGVSSLNAQEMEVLAAFHVRHDRINEKLLREAFSRAEVPSIPHVLLQLQSLLSPQGVTDVS
jgi:transposase InsO family protein